MNIHLGRDQTTGKPRLSLEQKIRVLLRKFRATERRRLQSKQKQYFRSKFSQLGILASVVALWVCVAFSFPAQAATASLAFQEANAAFASGNYPAAIKQYEAILAHEGYSAPALFNLGNAEYHDGQFGAAILSYERARVLAPRDQAIEANLRLARAKAGVPAPALNEAQNAALVLTPNTVAWTGSIALTVLCLAIGAGRLFPRFTRSKPLIGLAAVILLTVAATLAIRWPEFDRAIVVAAKVPARIAPASSAAELFPLKAGESVTALKGFGHFLLVRTPDGRSGWVSDKEIGLVFSAKPI